MPLPRSRVLLVDDREANLLVLEAFLEDLDCELVRATSGNEALKLLLRNEFALVLLDVQMPDMDGYEVARYARDHPATKDVPIIFLTAAVDSRDTNLRGFGAGAVDCLSKPFDPQVLRSKVKSFVDLHQAKLRAAEAIEAVAGAETALDRSLGALGAAIGTSSSELGRRLESIGRALDALDPGASQSLHDARRELEGARASLEELTEAARLANWFERSRVETGALAAEALVAVRTRMPDDSVEVEIHPLPVVDASEFGTRLLFVELFLDAFTRARRDPPRRIVVSSDESSSPAEFVVSDEPPAASSVDDGSQDPYQVDRRLHEDARRARCRWIVARHGGRFEIDALPGGGVRYRFTLAP